MNTYLLNIYQIDIYISILLAKYILSSVYCDILSNILNKKHFVSDKIFTFATRKRI